MRVLVPFVASLAVLLPACTTDSSNPTPCGAPQPAFHLTVRSHSGVALPDTTRITVTAGSGVETFVPGENPACPSMVFCTVSLAGDAGPGDAGADAACLDGGTEDAGPGIADVTVIDCALWTDGAAELEIQAAGYVVDRRTLKASTDGCGIVTVPADVQLDPLDTDGGTLRAGSAARTERP